MARDKTLAIIIFDQEIGKLGYDIDQGKSYFQYNPEFLASGQYSKLFPFIFKWTKPVQVFTEFQQNTFQGLPPMIADSLPDTLWVEIAGDLEVPSTILHKIHNDLITL